MATSRTRTLTIVKWLFTGESAVLLVLADILQDWDIWEGPGLHPLWWFAFASVGVTGVLWWRDRGSLRRIDPFICPECGYDRRGLAIDAKCPECGKA